MCVDERCPIAENLKIDCPYCEKEKIKKKNIQNHKTVSVK